jgi:hypothetical protein
VRHSRRTLHDRLERNRQNVPGLWQGRDRRRRRFHRDEQLQRGGGLRILILSHRRIVGMSVCGEVIDGGVAAEMRVHASGPMVLVMTVVVEVRVDQRGAQGSERQSDG